MQHDPQQMCPIVQHLSIQKAASAEPSTAIKTFFSYVFPSSKPAINALLATLYISGPPNFLLALCPPNIDPASLNIMVAFAVGGLLGDTLFHLLPEIFLGEDEIDKVKFVLLEPKRNLLLGCAILVGFMTFVAMDKGLRIATGSSGHSHDHSHSHASKSSEEEQGMSTGKSNGDHTGVRNRPKASEGKEKNQKALKDFKPESPTKSSDSSFKLGAYLNLIADFTHNITDGLAMSASFYTSPTIGATTTMAVFFHEIPHEVGDFALLVQSGFSKRAAMGAQFVTAIGALLGTCIGIAVQEYGGKGAKTEMMGAEDSMTGIAGTSLT